MTYKIVHIDFGWLHLRCVHLPFMYGTHSGTPFKPGVTWHKNNAAFAMIIIFIPCQNKNVISLYLLCHEKRYNLAGACMTLSIIVCGDMTSTETGGKLVFVFAFFYHLLKHRVLWSIKQSHNLIMRILILN